jgi:hypothetical protein
MDRLIGGSIAPSSQKVRILIDIPLAGKAELKNGFVVRKMDPQTPNLSNYYITFLKVSLITKNI